MNKILFLIFAVMIAAGSILLVINRQRELRNTPLPERPVAVFHVEEAIYGVLQITERYSSTLASYHTVNLAPQIQGRILSVHHKEGDSFSADEVLVEIDNQETLLQISSLEADLKRSESEVELRKSTFNRQKDLFEKQIISVQMMDEADAAYMQAVQSMKAVRAQLEAARTRMEYSILKAPFDGVVLERLQEPGDMAIPGRAILKLENPAGGYRISVYVPDRLTGSISPGTEVRLISGDDRQNAEVSGVLPATAGDTSLGIIEITLDERPFGLPIGSHLGILLFLDQPEGFIVPERSVLNLYDRSFVFVVGHENRLSAVEVRVLGRVKGRAVVSGELNDRDIVIVADESRLLSLNNNQQIKPVNGSEL